MKDMNFLDIFNSEKKALEINTITKNELDKII